ncbi:hypothetical protein AOX55_00003134 [Sinorhizobium fredii CCBAU 25509]|nr:hypothetical protein SF83666_c29460 [Sinorhizobium fredii CCBAU 83666]AWM26374.1 hypothetical protein AOX55_00003134 [Sinorhizobium fredii CCBAU 25509]
MTGSPKRPAAKCPGIAAVRGNCDLLASACLLAVNFGQRMTCTAQILIHR